MLYLSLVGAIGLAVLVSLEAEAARRHDGHHKHDHDHKHEDHEHDEEHERSVSTVSMGQRSPGLKEECSRRDLRCCHRHAWQNKVDPEEWELKTGCRMECCRDGSAPSRKSRKGVMRTQIIQDLISCITDIIGNVINLRFAVPKVCCNLPLMSLLPSCRGGGGGGADSGPRPPAPTPPSPASPPSQSGPPGPPASSGPPGGPPSPPGPPGASGPPGPSNGRPKGPGGQPSPPYPPPSDNKRRPGGPHPGLGRTSDDDEDY